MGVAQFTLDISTDVGVVFYDKDAQCLCPASNGWMLIINALCSPVPDIALTNHLRGVSTLSAQLA